MATAEVHDGDLTARARIRNTALELFAERGVAATSMRAIADGAGVSPALVVHHFGTKAGLVQAVDDVLTDTFRERLEEVEQASTPDVLSASAGDVFASVLGSDPVLRQYLRRSLLEDHPNGGALITQLFEWTTRGLEIMDRAGVLRPDADPMWRSYQVLYVILGPLVLESLLKQNLGADAFDPEVVTARSRANHDFFAHGLLAG